MNKRLIEQVVSRLEQPELAELHRLAERAVEECGAYREGEDGVILGQLKRAELTTAFKTLAVMLNRGWRGASRCVAPDRTAHLKELVFIREALAAACHARTAIRSAPEPPGPPDQNAPPTIEEAIRNVYEMNVGRTPAPEEIAIWLKNFENGLPFHHFVVLMSRSPEAVKHANSEQILEGKSDGAFVQTAYQLIHGRGCTAWEINHWVSRIVSGAMRRSDVLAVMFADVVKTRESGAGQAAHDGLSCRIMGTSNYVSVEGWNQKARTLREEPPPADENRYRHRFHLKSVPRVLVSAIASLYKGGDFIEQFMDNITSQSIFDDYCELIIVDADSPDDEYETIKRYLTPHKHINYIRVNYRIGIYDAWNVGVQAARGEYLTNTNLDDLRRADSFELQAAVLDNLPFVDVTYQDFYYTYDPRLSFGEIARFGYESRQPIVTPYTMMEFNSPHNAPMWRKRLHEELGYFNTHFKSAGDYEFWMRCLAAGKCFYRVNDPHVAYYQNPDGISTRPDTRGVTEAKEILGMYGSALVSDNLVMPLEQFCRERLPGVPPAMAAGRHDRYALAQLGLRNAARQLKFKAEQGVGP